MGKEKQNFTLYAKKRFIKTLLEYQLKNTHKRHYLRRMALYKYKNTPCFLEKLCFH
ncbi:Uncharacterized protein BM_BM13265 [Brugia malayi]|uniref:Bm13265 n=1 Tax=Brugia malayi TaxID=6279 RepID=A0A0J9XUF6_BRUMA|nr:Uncharacterized protein BM_BM13265 [Brugia malayi]CDP96047.1 Bm13265 [Brugia malayi]VIO88998.1 Uncharacterized protein BM_BM13265 [Brugia malayi]